MSNPIQHLLENEAFYEYLSSRPLLAMNLAEKRLRGASEASISRLLAACIECDLLDSNAGQGVLDEPLHPDTLAFEEAFNRMCEIAAICQSECCAAAHVTDLGGLQ